MSFRARITSVSFAVVLVASLATCDSEQPTQPATSIELSTTLLTFSAYRNDTLPDDRTFTVSNGGSGTLEWIIIDTSAWLDLSPTNGISNSQSINVSVNSTALDTGTYNTSLSVMSGNANNSPRDVFVSYVITISPIDGLIVGAFGGMYQVTTGYQTPSADTKSSTIEMRFSDQSYWFDSDNSPDNFCSPRGSYNLSNNEIEFNEYTDGCNVTADGSLNPMGSFSLRVEGDSLIMLQQSTDTLKGIYLVKR